MSRGVLPAVVWLGGPEVGIASWRVMPQYPFKPLYLAIPSWYLEAASPGEPPGMLDTLQIGPERCNTVAMPLLAFQIHLPADIRETWERTAGPSGGADCPDLRRDRVHDVLARALRSHAECVLPVVAPGQDMTIGVRFPAGPRRPLYMAIVGVASAWR